MIVNDRGTGIGGPGSEGYAGACGAVGIGIGSTTT